MTDLGFQVILAVGVVLLDYASQAAINPCEALMSDIMANQTEMSEETGFSFYSGMLSVGSCIGYLLTGMDKLTSEVDRVPVQYQNVYLDLFFW